MISIIGSRWRCNFDKCRVRSAQCWKQSSSRPRIFFVPLLLHLRACMLKSSRNDYSAYVLLALFSFYLKCKKLNNKFNSNQLEIGKSLIDLNAKCNKIKANSKFRKRIASFFSEQTYINFHSIRQEKIQLNKNVIYYSISLCYRL